ncbi:MAG: hypothetical protein NTX13_08650 [Acidobacteria bacterium]|nr:hypothetical protein [Acidobacteriota bacterium]
MILPLLATALVYGEALTDSTDSLVWGLPALARHTIGRRGPGLRLVPVELAGHLHQTALSYLAITGRQPDTLYPYRIGRLGDSAF